MYWFGNLQDQHHVLVGGSMDPSWRHITRFVPHVLHTITTGVGMCLHAMVNKLKRRAELEISNQAKRARVHDLNSNDQLSHSKPLVERFAFTVMSKTECMVESFSFENPYHEHYSE
jgi:hypothetical protein